MFGPLNDHEAIEESIEKQEHLSNNRNKLHFKILKTKRKNANTTKKTSFKKHFNNTPSSNKENQVINYQISTQDKTSFKLKHETFQINDDPKSIEIDCKLEQCAEKLDFTTEMILDELTIEVEKENKVTYQQNVEESYNFIKDLCEEEEKCFLSRNLNYMENIQGNINSNMRGVLIDWVMQISMQFGFKRNTFHQTISLIDKFLSRERNLPLNKFQLLGITAMLICSKMEVNNIQYYSIFYNNSRL